MWRDAEGGLGHEGPGSDGPGSEGPWLVQLSGAPHPLGAARFHGSVGGFGPCLMYDSRSNRSMLEAGAASIDRK